MKGRATFILSVMMLNTLLSAVTPASGETTVLEEIYDIGPETDSPSELIQVEEPQQSKDIVTGVDIFVNEFDTEETVTESVYMQATYATLPAPSEVEVILKDQDSITLYWNLPDSQYRDVKGFHIYRCSSPEGIFEEVGEVRRLQNNFTDSGLLPDETYYYQIVSVSDSGLESRPSSVIEATTDPDTTKPMWIKRTPTVGKQVGIYAPITVTFDDDMKAETITPYSFYVTDVQKDHKVPGTVEYLESEHKAIFIPTAPLEEEVTYEVTVTDSVTNVSNLSLTDPLVYTFTTTVFISPHGGYEVSSAPCASCHGTHASDGPKLLTQSDVQSLCMSCHNGEGSNVILIADKRAHQELRNCIECHDPHVPKTGVGTGGGSHPKG